MYSSLSDLGLSFARFIAPLLSLVNPTAFGRASRVHRLVHKLVLELDIKEAWRIEIAALLSQVGCVTVPEETLAKAKASPVNLLPGDSFADAGPVSLFILGPSRSGKTTLERFIPSHPFEPLAG